jgi:tetratricopeptide (TPR) repeat protein
MIMFKKKISNNYLIFFCGLSTFAAAICIHQKNSRPVINVTKQSSATNINSNFLRFFSLGNKRLISSIFWIQTLLESDEEKYKFKDKNSWMFLRFKTISELDPKFYENYLYGGLFLSIIKDDLSGAADIYESGLKVYPNDYQLNYNAGFNYYFEMGDFEKGLAKLENVQNHHDAAPALRFIINKLKFESGKDYEAALDFIYYSVTQTKDPILLKKLLSDLYALKAERDLSCLNEDRDNCDKIDAEGNPYTKSSLSWKAAKEFRPYRIHLKNKK